MYVEYSVKQCSEFDPVNIETVNHDTCLAYYQYVCCHPTCLLSSTRNIKGANITGHIPWLDAQWTVNILTPFSVCVWGVIFYMNVIGAGSQPTIVRLIVEWCSVFSNSFCRCHKSYRGHPPLEESHNTRSQKGSFAWYVFVFALLLNDGMMTNRALRQGMDARWFPILSQIASRTVPSYGRWHKKGISVSELAWRHR